MIKIAKQKTGIYILTTMCFMSILLSALGCSSNNYKNQEEFRMEYLEQLYRMDSVSDLYKNPSANESDDLTTYKMKIDERVIIYPEQIKLYIHCYSLFGFNEEICSLQDIIDLYNNYDEALHQKFLELYSWVTSANGRSRSFNYEMSIGHARILYEDFYGKGFIDKANFNQWTTDDQISLENYVRENPDFMPKDKYYEDLYCMGIISSEECKALRAASDSIDYSWRSYFFK